MGDSVRAFIAVALDQRARDELERLAGRLRAGSERWVRWSGPESVHLTLRFLGATPVDLVPRLASGLERAAAGARPFEVAMGAPGAFPNLHRPRVVWVGLAGDLAALEGLQRAVEGVVVDAGFPREARAFHPHLTLGRVREGAPSAEVRRLGEAIGMLPVPQDVRWRVDRVALIRSTLRPEGARYDILAEAPLGPSL